MRRRADPGAARGRHAVRGDGDPLPYQRPLRGLRGGARARASRSRARRSSRRERPGALKILERSDRSKTCVAIAEQGRTTSRTAREEMTRHADLARLVALAAEFDEANADFVADLRRASRTRRSAWRRPAHVPPREGARVRRRLPAASRRTRAARRSCRDARRSPKSAACSTSASRARAAPLLTCAGVPSRFLAELALEAREPRRAPEEACRPLLRRPEAGWRRDPARPTASPPYVVFHDPTLAEIARRRPEREGDLAGGSRRRPGEARALRGGRARDARRCGPARAPVSEPPDWRNREVPQRKRSPAYAPGTLSSKSCPASRMYVIPGNGLGAVSIS